MNAVFGEDLFTRDVANEQHLACRIRMFCIVAEYGTRSLRLDLPVSSARRLRREMRRSVFFADNLSQFPEN
jgi:hypothetical protein